MHLRWLRHCRNLKNGTNHICIPKRKNGVALVCNESDLKVAHSKDVFDVLMNNVLDVASLESEESTSESFR